MDEENEDLFDRKDLRRKKDKKRSHKQTEEKEVIAKESLKKMKDEIEELRKREINRSKEFDELRKKIEDQEKKRSNRDVQPEYALEFDKDIYLNKGFIESAKWVKDVIAKNMNSKMTSEKNKIKFEALVVAKRSCAYLGARACARFNRGEPCHQGKWHTTHGPEARRPEALWTRHGPVKEDDQRNQTLEQQGRRNELRLHACTLCLEALGSANGHSILDCPWILKKNWNE